jgi:hypothetical protein
MIGETKSITCRQSSESIIAKVAPINPDADSASSSFRNTTTSQGHRRRRSSAADSGQRPAPLPLGAQTLSHKPSLSPIPGKYPSPTLHFLPFLPFSPFSACLKLTTTLARWTGTPGIPMSLSRSPSPIPGGGWSSPGLMTSSGRSSPAKASFSGSNGGGGGSGANVTWESARLKTQGVSNYPSFSTQNQGFFQRHMRRISQSLPTFNAANMDDQHFAEKEKLGRGRWNIPLLGRVRGLVNRMGRKWKIRAMILGFFFVCYCLFYMTRK